MTMFIGIFSFAACGQTTSQEATTTTGKKVVLYSDGTWKYKDGNTSTESASAGCDKFIGTWVNNGSRNGLNYGATVTISSNAGNIIVRLDPKSGISPLQNTGDCKDGKIEVSLPHVGQVKISYIETNGKKSIVFMGATLDKTN